MGLPRWRSSIRSRTSAQALCGMSAREAAARMRSSGWTPWYCSSTRRRSKALRTVAKSHGSDARIAEPISRSTLFRLPQFVS